MIMNSGDTSRVVDVDSSVVIPCLDQWVTLLSGEMMGIVYHSDTNEGIYMNDGDIIATSPAVQEVDVTLLQEGMNVATISGTEYTLLNRATVEMAQHYNYLLENTDSAAEEDMPNPPIPTAASSLSSMVVAAPTESFTTITSSSSSLDTTDTPEEESQDKAKELLQKVKDAGVSGAISYALWEFAFWTLSLPVGLVAYRSLTGHWPDFESTEDWKQLGGEAFVFVNLARFAVPIRIGLALSTVPWVQTNLVDRFSSEKEGKEQQELSVEQIRAIEEYKHYLTQRPPELRQRLEPPHQEEPQRSPYEEYEQYRQQRSPELQQQLQQYQQQQAVDEGSSLSSEQQQSAAEAYQQYLYERSPELRQLLEHEEEPQTMSAYEEYEQYRQQRSPELQQQYQQVVDEEESSLSEEQNAAEAYQQYLEQRSPELRKQLEPQQHEEEPQMSSYEEYEQYRQQRSPELQQQLQQYQQVEESSSSEQQQQQSAMEVYQEFVKQRSPEVQQQFLQGQQGQQEQEQQEALQKVPLVAPASSSPQTLSQSFE